MYVRILSAVGVDAAVAPQYDESTQQQAVLQHWRAVQ